MDRLLRRSCSSEALWPVFDRATQTTAGLPIRDSGRDDPSPSGGDCHSWDRHAPAWRVSHRQAGTWRSQVARSSVLFGAFRGCRMASESGDRPVWAPSSPRLGQSPFSALCLGLPNRARPRWRRGAAGSAVGGRRRTSRGGGRCRFRSAPGRHPSVACSNSRT